ncbi:MAG: hypothetical protein Ta2G_03190 [Termitinemataceae bacterium]|nr:MAG: hypothetical protein Ta2G_03190 [Termitinemataceae bacterium]
MTILESVKQEIDTLSEDALSDTKYLNSIPGMAKSIREGIETPLSDCVPLSEVWSDV